MHRQARTPTTTTTATTPIITAIPTPSPTATDAVPSVGPIGDLPSLLVSTDTAITE